MGRHFGCTVRHRYSSDCGLVVRRVCCICCLWDTSLLSVVEGMLRLMSVSLHPLICCYYRRLGNTGGSAYTGVRESYCANGKGVLRRLIDLAC